MNGQPDAHTFINEAHTDGVAATQLCWQNTRN